MIYEYHEKEVIPECLEQVHGSTGTLINGTSKHQMWHPALHLSQTTILIALRRAPHTK